MKYCTYLQNHWGHYLHHVCFDMGCLWATTPASEVPTCFRSFIRPLIKFFIVIPFSIDSCAGSGGSETVLVYVTLSSSSIHQNFIPQLVNIMSNLRVTNYIHVIVHSFS